MEPKPQTKPPMIGALIAGAASLGGTIAQAISQRKSERRTLSANRQLAQEAYDRDLTMWNKANEYNTPEAQMLRLTDANLNPNLIYGNGAAGGTAAQTMPKYQAPSAQYNALPIAEGLQNTISTFQDIQLKSAQIDNVRAQADINRANANWQNLLAQYRAQGGVDNARKARMIADMMANTFEDNTTGQPTPWQLYQLQLMEGKARAGRLAYDKTAADIAKMKAATRYQNMMTEWYSGKAIMALLGTGAGILKGFLPKISTAGKAFPGKGMTRAQSKKLEEFKKTFIKNYERK